MRLQHTSAPYPLSLPEQIQVFTGDAAPILCHKKLLEQVSGRLPVTLRGADGKDQLESIYLSHLEGDTFRALYELLVKFYRFTAGSKGTRPSERDESGTVQYLQTLTMDTVMYILCTLIVFFDLRAERGDHDLYSSLHGHLIDRLNRESEFDQQELRTYIRMYNATRPPGHDPQNLSDLRRLVTNRVCQNYSILMQRDIRIHELTTGNFRCMLNNSALVTVACPNFFLDILRSDLLMTEVDNNTSADTSADTTVDEDYIANHVYIYLTFHLFTTQREHTRCPSSPQISEIIRNVRTEHIKSSQLRESLVDIWRMENPIKDFHPNSVGRRFFPVSERQRLDGSFWQYLPSVMGQAVRPRRRHREYESLMTSFRITPARQSTATARARTDGATITQEEEPGGASSLPPASMMSEFFAGPIAARPRKGQGAATKRKHRTRRPGKPKPKRQRSEQTTSSQGTSSANVTLSGEDLDSLDVFLQSQLLYEQQVRDMESALQLQEQLQYQLQRQQQDQMQQEQGTGLFDGQDLLPLLDAAAAKSTTSSGFPSHDATTDMESVFLNSTAIDQLMANVAAITGQDFLEPVFSAPSIGDDLDIDFSHPLPDDFDPAFRG